jgi:hypothetical protein
VTPARACVWQVDAAVAAAVAAGGLRVAGQYEVRRRVCVARHSARRHT